MNTKTDAEIHRQIDRFYRQRKVLVAGADGFVGYNAVRRLTRLGANVSIISRRSDSRASREKISHYFCGDLRDRQLMQAAVAGQSIVFDFAGASGAVASVRDPFSHLQLECGPHLTLFNVCVEQNPKPLVVFCSTRLVYGKPAAVPVDERHPVAPLDIYAVHKITLENYLQAFYRTEGLPFCIMRLSNPYGPFQPTETSQYGIINLFIRHAAQNLPMTIFGDGLQKRDYVFIEDVITAFLMLAMTKSCRGEIFNFGGRENASIRESIEIISSLAGGSPIDYKPWPEDYRKVETGDYQSDLGKIDRFVKLPVPVSMREGYRRTLEFYRDLESLR